MKKIVLLLIVNFFISQIFAQKIAGIVLNENKEPIPGATVKIENTFYITTTNPSGQFEFDKLKLGKYSLTTSFMGFETQTKEIEINQESQSVEIMMKTADNLTDEVIINALRAGKKTPVASSEISKEELKKNNLGQDIPYLLSQMPSITISSDAGTGIGYSKLSIRGTDLTRINVTVNGIPLNDAESHGVYWVDLPDLSSSVENIQVQRGVGTSTNGAGAFGANINFATNQLQKEAYSQLATSYGSFNSYKGTIKAGTGLINKHFAFDLRLSKIHSEGFIDRGRSDMESFYTSGTYTDAKTLIKFNIISGKEETYQAWQGIPKVRLTNDTAGMHRYFNDNLYSFEEYQNMLGSDSRTYNYYTYKNQIDHYIQTHYQTFISRELNPNLMMNLAFNYTKGKGYYEEYKKNQELSTYQIIPAIVGVDTVYTSDLIRRKWLDNDLYVLNFSLDYKKNNTRATIGGSWQDYYGRHYGNVIWARFAGNSEIDHQWYYSVGDKREFNVYAKFEYLIFDMINVYADLQLRKIDYSINGIDDNLVEIDQNYHFNFFNPKFGAYFNIADGQHMYFTYGKAHREPTRTDFIESTNNNAPKPESLNDYELGYSLTAQNVYINMNLYYMDYINQLVKTGKINDVGDPIMINIPNSYRQGIEISSMVKFNQFIDWKFNATFSKNKIKKYTEFVDNWDQGGQNEIPIGESNLSFSPEKIIGSELEVMPFKGFQIALLSKYVGQQYIDNSSSKDRMLNEYFVNHLRFNYRIETKFLKSIELQFMINNLFDQKYETDAWVYRYFYNGAYNNWDGYFPQAGINFLAGIVLNF